MPPPSDAIRMSQTEIVRLLLAFCEQSDLHGSAAALEWESGLLVADGMFPGSRLRSLLLRGRWTEALSFVQGLELTEGEAKMVHFQIAKQKYVELVCIYQLKPEDLDNAIAVCFSELSSPNLQEREHLKNLLKLADDPVYRHWTPFESRRNCFCVVWGIVKRLFRGHPEVIVPGNSCDRLVVLLAKGLLYESCETYCRNKARSKSNAETDFTFGSLVPDEVAGTGGGASREYVLDSSLFSWLHTVPWISLARDFVCRPLKVEVRKLEKPSRAESPETEKFWNGMFSKSLMVDAPEILKRAEEVVNRWEERRKAADKIPNVNPVEHRQESGGGENANRKVFPDGKSLGSADKNKSDRSESVLEDLNGRRGGKSQKFEERKKYITDLLNAKDRLRRGLLQTLKTEKDTPIAMFRS